MKKIWIAFALAGLLATPVSQADEPAANPVQTDNPKYLKTLKRVAVTSFSVEILTYLKASEGGDLGNLISGKPNSVSVTLKGHDAASWQQVVDNYIIASC